MTAREWIEKHFPDQLNKGCAGGVCGCPYDYDIYLGRPKNCTGDDSEGYCTACWDREIPEIIEEETKPMITMETPAKTTRKTKNQLLEEINDLKKELVKLEKYRQFEECATEMYAILEAFMNSGFTRDEAFKLLTTAMGSKLVK